MSDITQHPLLSALLNSYRSIPSHQLLMDAFEPIPWKYLAKNISQLLHCCNILQLQSTFMYLLATPNMFLGIMLDPSKMRQKSLCHNHLSIIILMNMHIHCSISNDQSNRFTKKVLLFWCVLLFGGNQDIQGPSIPNKVVLSRLWISMQIIHDDLDATSQEIYKCISQEAILLSLICEFVNTLDVFLLSSMWDI